MVSSIRARIAAMIASLMLLLHISVGAYLYFSLRFQLTSALDRSLQSNTENLRDTLSSVVNELSACSFQPNNHQTLANFSREDLVRMVMSNGAPLDTRGEEGVAVPLDSLNGQSGYYTVSFYEELSEAAPEDLYPFSLFEEHDPSGVWRIEKIRLYSTPITIAQNQICYLQVGENLRLIERTLQRFLLLVTLAAPAILSVTAASSYWLAGQALRPMEQIRQRAALISAQDLSQRLNFHGANDEVGRLAQTFDDMLDRLAMSFQRQQQFASDASHELRTPLAIIRGEVDVTLARLRQPAEYQATLHSIGDEVERLTRLVSSLLLLSRREQNKLQLHLERLDLADLLTILLEQMQPQADLARVSLFIDLTTPLWINGDADRLLQLFINILENAFIYAPGSQVEVQGKERGNEIVITVIDGGPGIAPEHLPHLFERFYRVDKVRSRTSGGSGLGLAIAQEIAQAHCGNITVTSQPTQGTTFTICIPAASENLPELHNVRNEL